MPERTCVCCNVKKEKDEMIRVSANFKPDNQKNDSGRGFYVCRNSGCINKLSSGKTSIARSLKTRSIDKMKLKMLSNNLAEIFACSESLVKVMNVKDKSK